MAFIWDNTGLNEQRQETGSMLRFHSSCPPRGYKKVTSFIAIVFILISGDPVGALPHCSLTKVNSLLVANCQGQRHKVVPKTDPSVEVLLLNFNLFSTISTSSFAPMKSLIGLSLGKQLSGAVFVGERAFQNVPNITFLDLGGNMNLALHPGAFGGLSSLEVLLLDANGFDEGVLERAYFQDLVALKRLDLSGNHIRRLMPDPSFQGLKALSSLQLKLNRIVAICGDDLRYLKGRHLDTLDLSSNRLQGLLSCGNPFHNITLGTLDISSNPWNVKEMEIFISSLNGTKIQNLKIQHSGGIGSGYGYNNLKDLLAGTFSGLRHAGLVSLDMSHGFLNQLVLSAFSGLPDLEFLRLASNEISQIQDGAFVGLGELRVLDLSNNLLGELTVEALKALRQSPLEHLILKSNHIGVIQHGALVGLSVQVLDLQDNALFRFPTEKLPSLRHLLLAQNRIQDVYGIEHLSRDLTHLDLSSNRISDLGLLWSQLEDALNLLSLNLSDNHLARCVSAKKSPRRLQELDLSRNRVGDIWETEKCTDVFQNLESLAVLNLSSNAVRSLPGGLFRNLGSLKTLDLSFNRLPWLPEDTFQSLGSLKTLSLRGNPMVTLSPALFVSLKQLQSLDLRELSLFCDCGLSDFHRWMEGNMLKLILAERMLICIQPKTHSFSLPAFLEMKCSP